MTIRPLTSLAASALPPGVRLKVCVVSLIGAARNGGIGTATDAMVRHIAQDGHEVTLLYSLVEHGVPVNVAQGDGLGDGLRSWQDWREDLAADGVRLELLDHQASHNDWLQKSWSVKEFIGARAFDVVYFDEWQGTGYYSLLAKRAGLQPFAAQVHVVFTHASKQWVCVTNDEYLRQVSDVTVLGMERRSVEMADVVISPSRYLLEEYARYGWSLPANSFHHPLPLLKAPVTVDGRRRSVDEIVFFGRLETRKGLWLFCDALDRLGDRLAGKTVTFMGPLTGAYGTSSGMELLQRSANWRFKVRLVTDLGSKGAQAYLAAGRRLAVMPSLDDNSPCVIYECMQAGIPFVTTSSGGGKELIDERFWSDAVVEPTVDALAARLATLLRDGMRSATPSFAPTQALAVWTGWLRLVAQDKAAFRVVRKAEAFLRPKSPPVLVVIDSGRCPVSVLVGTLVAMVERFGTRARCILVSDRRGKTWEAVTEILAGLSGAEIDCFGPDSHDTAQATIAAADIAFLMDADTELRTPFFLMALGTLAQPGAALVTCLGATRRQPAAEPAIEVLPAGDIPGLAALGHVVTGPIWAMAPQRLGRPMAALVLRDASHGELFSAWTLGETMARALGKDRLVLLPMVGAITAPANGAGPLQTADRLRSGARDLGLGSSLHRGGASRFAIETFGARSEMPAGALTLAREPAVLPGPMAQALAEAERADDLARMAAICGRADLALQIEAGQDSSAARVDELIGLAVATLRQRPVLDLLPALAGAVALDADAGRDPDADADETSATESPALAFRDPRVAFANGRLRATGSTRSGGPAKFWLLDLPVAGQVQLDLRLQSLASQPLFLRVQVIDQDCGEKIAEAALRIVPRDLCETRLALPGIFGRFAVLLEFSGADRIDLAFDTMALQ